MVVDLYGSYTGVPFQQIDAASRQIRRIQAADLVTGEEEEAVEDPTTGAEVEAVTDPVTGGEEEEDEERWWARRLGRRGRRPTSAATGSYAAGLGAPVASGRGSRRKRDWGRQQKRRTGQRKKGRGRE